MRRVPGTIAIAAVTVAGVASGCFKPAPSQATTRTVHVSATDSKGAPVTDLTAADITVKDDGKAREVLKVERASRTALDRAAHRRQRPRRERRAPGRRRVRTAAARARRDVDRHDGRSERHARRLHDGLRGADWRRAAALRASGAARRASARSDPGRVQVGGRTALAAPRDRRAGVRERRVQQPAAGSGARRPAAERRVAPRHRRRQAGVELARPRRRGSTRT